MQTAPSHQTLAVAIRQAAASSSPACVLDGRGAYLFASEAWQRHEAERRGAFRDEPLVGTAFVDGLESVDLRRLWGAALQDVLSGWAHERVVTGEHNTPHLARLVSTRIRPVSSGQAILGLVLVRTTVRERPIADLYPVSRRDRSAYEDGEGRVTLCGCCRRARCRRDPSLWEIVPCWVAAPPATAWWTTCELCAELHLGVEPQPARGGLHLVR